MSTILAIDQGTTNSKALLVNAGGAIVAQGSTPLTQHYPHPAWVEQDAREIWQSVRKAIAECLASASSADRAALTAIAITNQRETVMLWERTSGQPLGPAIIWQCRRTAPFCEELRARGLEPTLSARTGLTIDPLFSATKARWLLDNALEASSADTHRRAEAGELCIGTMDSWVLWNLTGGRVHACDLSNASRTQMLDIHTLDWSADLLAIFGIPRAALPEVKPSGALYGESVALDGLLPAGIPIAAMMGDSHAALFGQAGFQPGAVKATYGTGSSLMTPIATLALSKHGLSTTIAWATPRSTTSNSGATYALEGNITNTGGAVQWLGEFLNFADPANDVAKLAATAEETDGVYFVPALAGLGAPHWDEAARGLISGLTRGSTLAHLARATLDSVAYQVRDVFEVMSAEAGAALDVLLADGGASRNDRLMQFQADILGRPVLRNLSTNVSALGVAYMAGLTVGLWASEAELAALPRPQDRFEPKLPEARRDALYAGWQEAVARTTFRPVR